MKKIILFAAALALISAPALSQGSGSTANKPTGHVGSGQRAGGPAHEQVPAGQPNPAANSQRPAVSPLQTGSGQRAGGPAREAISETGGTPRPTNPPSPHIGSGQRAGGPAHENIPPQKRQ